MPVDRNRLYRTLILACLAGYGWLSYNLIHGSGSGVTACVWKRVTHIPCPSCGSTRSVLYLLQGHIEKGLYTNPLGVFLLAGLLIVPLWIGYDVYTRKSTCLHMYHTMESTLRKPFFALLFGLCIVLNWIWNLYKGL